MAEENYTFKFQYLSDNKASLNALKKNSAGLSSIDSQLKLLNSNPIQQTKTVSQESGEGSTIGNSLKNALMFNLGKVTSLKPKTDTKLIKSSVVAGVKSSSLNSYKAELNTGKFAQQRSVSTRLLSTSTIVKTKPARGPIIGSQDRFTKGGFIKRSSNEVRATNVDRTVKQPTQTLPELPKHPTLPGLPKDKGPLNKLAEEANKSTQQLNKLAEEANKSTQQLNNIKELLNIMNYYTDQFKYINRGNTK